MELTETHALAFLPFCEQRGPQTFLKSHEHTLTTRSSGKTKRSSTIPSLTGVHEGVGSEGKDTEKKKPQSVDPQPPRLLNKHLDVGLRSGRGPELLKSSDIPSAMGSSLGLLCVFVLLLSVGCSPGDLSVLCDCSELMTLLMLDPLSLFLSLFRSSPRDSQSLSPPG